MNTRRRLARLEQDQPGRELAAIEAALAAMPPREPPTIEELRELQRELGIPANVMAELFPKWKS